MLSCNDQNTNVSVDVIISNNICYLSYGKETTEGRLQPYLVTDSLGSNWSFNMAPLYEKLANPKVFKMF